MGNLQKEKYFLQYYNSHFRQCCFQSEPKVLYKEALAQGQSLIYFTYMQCFDTDVVSSLKPLSQTYVAPLDFIAWINNQSISIINLEKSSPLVNYSPLAWCNTIIMSLQTVELTSKITIIFIIKFRGNKSKQYLDKIVCDNITSSAVIFQMCCRYVSSNRFLYGLQNILKLTSIKHSFLHNYFKF